MLPRKQLRDFGRWHIGQLLRLQLAQSAAVDPTLAYEGSVAKNGLKESGKATFADKLDSWPISSMLPPELK